MFIGNLFLLAKGEKVNVAVEQTVLRHENLILSEETTVVYLPKEEKRSRPVSTIIIITIIIPHKNPLFKY